MIKYFCDRCGKEMQSGRKIYTGVYDALGVLITTIETPKHLCEKCGQKLDSIKDKLEHEEDFFNMTEEEIRLLSCTFKVGDNVVTSDGRTGVIISICDCDRCKGRGFYEPTVKMDDGDTEYIMISDKDNGFKSYYKIGDQVFGNLDEDFVNKEIKEHQNKLMQLYDQRHRIEKLKQRRDDYEEDDDEN